MDKKRIFTSRWGFILSAVGSAVGMANVWGFPAKMGANGGFAFLVAYLIFVALFSVVGLAAEYAIGRRARTGTLGAYRNAWESRSPKLGKAGVAEALLACGHDPSVRCETMTIPQFAALSDELYRRERDV